MSVEMDAAAMSERLEACYAEVERQRMEGVPILNCALDVKAVGMRDWNGYWLCILVTPWFMNIMLLPCDAAQEIQRIPTGTKRHFAFPAGKFEFIHGEEAAIGSFWMCSLFSPMFEFGDQETAEATAMAALQALFEQDEEASSAEREMDMIWRGERPEETAPVVETDEVEDHPVADSEPRTLNRRTFLTGSLDRERT
jgi:[NiFe] hydrogenase assembly HybE family chaperone